MAGAKRTESICLNCGFQIITDYPYHTTCPICGQPLINRKPVAVKAAVNKKKQRSKEANGTETGKIQ